MSNILLGTRGLDKKWPQCATAGLKHGHLKMHTSGFSTYMKQNTSCIHVQLIIGVSDTESNSRD